MKRLVLSDLAARPVDAMAKGFPSCAPAMPLADIGQQGWNLLKGDLPLPVAVLHQSRLNNNRRWMRTFTQISGVSLSPHSKTTMSPQLVDLQLEDGAWAITCATAHHVEIFRRFGASRIILANQLVGIANLRSALRHLHDPGFELFVLVDSIEGVHALAETARDLKLARPVLAMLEVGAPSGRTGARTLDAAQRIATAISQTGGAVSLVGIETYESLFHTLPCEQAEFSITALLSLTATIVAVLDDEGCFAPHEEIIVSAGGSDYFDIVAGQLDSLSLSRPHRVVLRSGCYITSDSFYYNDAFTRIKERQPSLASLDPLPTPALEVWAAIQSRPEPQRMYATLGKRDASYDWTLPQPHAWFRPGLHSRPVPLPATCRTLLLNDQHAHLEVAADAPFTVGDLLGFGIAHPCTTFDKWRLIHVLDDDYTVVNAILTFF